MTDFHLNAFPLADVITLADVLGLDRDHFLRVIVPLDGFYRSTLISRRK